MSKKTILPFRVLCINSNHKPDGIPDSKWIKKDEFYTVTKVVRLLIQGGSIGFELAEKDLTGCFPYLFFSSSRFAIAVESRDELDGVLEEILEQARKEENLVEESV